MNKALDICNHGFGYPEVLGNLVTTRVMQQGTYNVFIHVSTSHMETYDFAKLLRNMSHAKLLIIRNQCIPVEKH